MQRLRLVTRILQGRLAFATSRRSPSYGTTNCSKTSQAEHNPKAIPLTMR